MVLNDAGADADADVDVDANKCSARWKISSGLKIRLDDSRLATQRGDTC